MTKVNIAASELGRMAPTQFTKPCKGCGATFTNRPGESRAAFAKRTFCTGSCRMRTQNPVALTESQIAEVRERYADGETQEALAYEFRVKVGVIQKACVGARESL